MVGVENVVFFNLFYKPIFLCYLSVKNPIFLLDSLQTSKKLHFLHPYTGEY